jgi:hypothetical protein
MRITTTLLALAGAVSAHYTFPALIYGGTTTTDWQYVRDGPDRTPTTPSPT